MKKVLLPLGLTLSILLVFVLGIILSENVAKNRKDTVDLIFEQQKKEKEMQQLNDAVSEHFNDFDKIELQTDKPLISKYEDDENNQVLARYQIINDDSTIGTLYIVYVTGGKDGLKIAVVVEPTNREILGYKIIENNETPSYFANIPQEFLNSFSNID
jgi:Na+-translocating ferredoxin:NAD+ oxidoreductase RnfG subunit